MHNGPAYFVIMDNIIFGPIFCLFIRYSVLPHTQENCHESFSPGNPGRVYAPSIHGF